MAITMDTDWGAKGAQLTGAQVQEFIKSQLRSLQSKDTSLQSQINSLNTEVTGFTPQLKAAADGCFVVYTEYGSNVLRAVPYWQWPSKAASGEIATGVLVTFDDHAPIIISLTEAKLKWSKNAIQINSPITDAAQLYQDFSGKTKTAAIIARGNELFGGDTSTWGTFAPGWCNQYVGNPNRSGANPLPAGSWWLPSISELMAIWRHKEAINLCLSVIDGATTLDETVPYWSITEYSANYAWYLGLGDGYLNDGIKTRHAGCVRAVAAFH